MDLDAIITTAVLFFLIGCIFTLVVLYWFVKLRIQKNEKSTYEPRDQFPPFQIPKEIKEILSSPNKLKEKESCRFLNIFLQFLFKELRDTKKFRQWAIKKMNVEFQDLMKTTSGKLIDQISVKDFSMGRSIPFFHSINVKNVSMDRADGRDELELELDLDYFGGFQLGMDIDLVFGKKTFLSIAVNHLQGLAQLKLSRHPYTHWSFSFYKEPLLELEVESLYGTRSFPQITSLVVTQIKRVLRKKHIIPNYKMRFKPFFDKPLTLQKARKIKLMGHRIGEGRLEVTIRECSRLDDAPADSKLFCTLALDEYQWEEAEKRRQKILVTHDVILTLKDNVLIGLNLRDDPHAVVVDSITQNSVASKMDIKKGDSVMRIGLTKITSAKQAKKLIRNAKDSIKIRIQRAKNKETVNTALLLQEDMVSLHDFDDTEKETTDDKDTEFVNISYSPTKKPSEHFGIISQSVDYKSTILKNARSNVYLEQRKSRGSADDQGDSSCSDNENEFTGSWNKSHSASASPKKQVESSIRQRALSDTMLIKISENVSASEDEDEGLNQSDDDEDEGIRTSDVSFSKCPMFGEKFGFSVDKKHKYLNICLWCKMPVKQEKNEQTVRYGKEVLWGYVSLSVSDVCLECLTTTQGDTKMTIPLQPEPRAGASRIKYPQFASHKGYESDLCYGDMTLLFQHVPGKIPESLRPKLSKEAVFYQSNDDEDKDEEECLETPEPIVTKLTGIKEIERGSHDFTKENFTEATYCNFCGKKIWFKEAFQCSTCHMKCHKKCTEKCQAQTICSSDGPKRKTNPDEVWKAPVSQNDPSKKKVKVIDGKAGGLLSKFRKDIPEKKSVNSQSLVNTNIIPPGNRTLSFTQKLLSPVKLKVPFPSAQLSPQLTRRRNSAPGKDREVTTGEPEVAASAIIIPHAKSSSGIQRLSISNSVHSMPGSDASDREVHSDDSSSDSDNEWLANMSKMNITKGQNMDEIVVTAAKEMGKELFAELSIDERKEKLDSMVTKLQMEIDKESENKKELQRLLKDTIDPGHKEAFKKRLAKSEEKVEAMMMMMLHYCAGLQYCLDHENEEKSRLLNQDLNIIVDSDDNQDRVDSNCDPLGVSKQKNDKKERKESTSKIKTPDIKVTCSLVDDGDKENIADADIDDSNVLSEREDSICIKAHVNIDEEDDIQQAPMMFGIEDLTEDDATRNIDNPISDFKVYSSNAMLPVEIVETDETESDSDYDIFQDLGHSKTKNTELDEETIQKNDQKVELDKEAGDDDQKGHGPNSSEDELFLKEGQEYQVHFGVDDNSLHSV